MPTMRSSPVRLPVAARRYRERYQDKRRYAGLYQRMGGGQPRRAGADHNRTVKNRFVAGLTAQFCYFCVHACTCRSHGGHNRDRRDIWSFSGIWQDFAGIRSHMADGIDGDSSRHGPAFLPQPVVNH
ncbi:hypothetical protein NKH36_13235 [Mesorhizobium sp. M1312]|uniref:hypothetical protein n=1 Tax=unclassified Mesorhizobium TaxID=325217 RepID=UPI00333BA4C3